MHYDDGFKILIPVFFSVIPQLGGLGPKAQDLVVPFRLCEGEPLIYFHLIPLAIRSELVFIRDQTVHINNLTGKYIMELSNLKHLQPYMTYFEIDFRRFERLPQRDQLYIIFTPSM